jgi:hypothetical protein
VRQTEPGAQPFKLPLYFIENAGQADARVRYDLHGRDTAVYFTGDGMVVGLSERTFAGGPGCGR